MRLPRVRFTTRRMIISVAVTCVILGAVQFRRRREFCLSRALYHRHHVMFWNGNHIGVGFGRARRGRRLPPPDWEKLQDQRRRDLHLDWHWRLAERYERAALLPWSATPSEPLCPGSDDFHALHVGRGWIANP